jgi:squalene-hopene/tetraprenyl-beta-curcumene cyclase
MTRPTPVLFPVILIGFGLLLVSPLHGEQAAKAPAAPAQKAPATASMSAATRAQALASLKKGADYLRKEQGADGLWDKNYGVSGVAALALLNEPGVTKAESLKTVGKTLDALAKLAKPDGGIYDQAIPHYITAVSVSAMAAAGRPQDQALIKAGAQYLVANMLDDSEGIAKTDFWYGGMGYGGATRPDRKADIISLEYALRAMHDAELPANDAAWQKALTFLQRTQNHSETNDQKWATNDGGFVYYPGFSYSVEGPTRSYGSSTYAGVMSYTWANLKKNDPRVQAVMKWVRDNYTVDENPGTGQKTVYYYYMVMAKALAAVGEPTITDATGRKHNWRDELAQKLISLQHPEGFWVNPVKDEMQDNPRLVTAFVLSALEAILK